MANGRLVLIASPELIPALRERIGNDDSLDTFADSEPLRALDAITRQRPSVVALERLFAASPRGAALIARIKADAALNDAEIHILSHDSDYKRISPRRSASAPVVDRAAQAAERVLDKGTRRSPRYRIDAGAQALCEGQPARLVDLSEHGVQLVSPVTLRAKQEVSVALGPAEAGLGARGIIMWAREESSEGGSTYRVGIDFIDPDRKAIGAFCQAHGRL